MSTKIYRSTLAAFVLALSAASGFGQEPPAVDSETPPILKRQTRPAAETALRRDDSETAIPFTVVLPEVSAAEKSAVLAAPGKGALRVGFPRPVPEHFQGDLVPLLSFDETEDGSRVAAFTVVSPGAGALRLSLAAPRMPEGAELRVFGFVDPHQVYGPYDVGVFAKRPGRSKQGLAGEPFWTPVIEGDEVGLEIALPRGADPEDLELAVLRVSHLEESVHDSMTKNLSDIGRAGSCNVDAVCHNEERRHTAKFVYTDANGLSWTCSGTLMNDADNDSLIPFFLTADHCINTQGEASTVNSFWHFERATCGGANPTSVNQLTGGAELLAHGSTNDFSLLQLNDQVPFGGVVHSGWDSAAVSTDTSIVGIHHPKGDLKKWSSGSVTDASGNYLKVVWSQGTTEKGSSGSGLFDGSERLRGFLSGGDASCSSTTSPDWYGRFDQAFPSMRQWLWDGATTLASGQGRSGSVAQGQWKEYKITTPMYAWQVAVELYGLSNDADLYVREGTRPTLSSYDCRPYSGGATSETCYQWNNAPTTWYVGVRGYSAGTTSFTVRATIY